MKYKINKIEAHLFLDLFCHWTKKVTFNKFKNNQFFLNLELLIMSTANSMYV